MTAAVVENMTRPLVAEDRCDRCGAAAALVARAESNMHMELFFCSHHGEEHKEALIDSGFYFDNETVEERIGR